MQKAFAGPYVLKRARRDARPEAARGAWTSTEAFATKPAIHRFPGAMATRVRELAAVVAEEYDGDASRIWTEADRHAPTCSKRIGALPGFGEMKIKSLGAVLAKQFGVKAAEELAPGPPDARRRHLARGARAVPGWKRAYKRASCGAGDA